jgi:hypothetical protein
VEKSKKDDLSMLKIHGAKTVVALIALTIGAGAMQANSLTETPAAGSAGGGVTLTCSTTAGPGPAVNITLKPAGTIGSSTYVVTYTNMSGFTITPPSTTSITSGNATTGIVYSIQANAGCAGVSGTLQFLVGGTDDVTVAITDTVTATASALVAPATLAISCALNAGTYTPGATQTVSVTSAAPGGTPFTVDTTAANDPTWVTLNPVAPGSYTAGTTAATFTVAATPTGGSPGCGGFSVNTTHTFNLHLKSGVSGTTPDVKILVTLSIVPLSPLIVTPVAPATSLSLSYVKSSGNAGTVNVSVTSPTVPGAYFTVNTNTFPNWLTVDYQTGNTTKALRFSTTNVADSLAPGTYTSTITMSVSSYADLSVTVTMLLTNKPATLSVTPAAVTINWTLGAGTPTATLTATSTDTPIAFSITTGGTLLPIVNPAGPAQETNLGTNQLTGLAYSFGTNIPITFNSSLFSSVTPGQQLTGTVTFTWGSPAAVIVVPVTINVQSPGATLTSISPATIPLAAPGTSFVISLTGTGFVGGSDPTTKTRIGTVAGAAPGAISPDTNFSLVWVNANNMTLTITVPNTPDGLLPFSPTGITVSNVTTFGGSIFLGIVNGTSSAVPTGTKTLTIGNGPLVQGVTSSSSFTEVSGTTLPTIAPYDMISIFGANFCASGGTGCATATILQNAPDSVYFRYPTTLSPDAVSATQRLLSVNFMAHGTTTPVWPAPLLFATNGQINALVPAAALTAVGTVANGLGVDISVTFGYGSGATLLKSNTFPVNIAASDPGLFTIGSDGQGAPAALNSNWALIGPTNPAGMRNGSITPNDSDTIQLYVTGLGAPTSQGDNTSAGDGSAALTNCIGAVTASGTGNYQATLGGGFTNIDGDVIQQLLLNTSRFAPCLTTVPVVTIGGVQGTVSYAGFVSNTVAGLYQVNVQLPASTGATLHPDYPTNSVSAQITTLKTPTQLPVFVTVGGGTPSQAGVMLSVIPRLLMTAPSSLTTLQVGHFWTGTVLAQEGTGSPTFAITSGSLPAGLALVATTGVISGHPGPNTNGNFTVTVTATDTASVPLTGSVTFTLSVAGGLYVTSTGTAPYITTFGSIANSLTVVTALGGVYPYVYTINTPSTIPLGMTIPTTVSGQNSIGTLKTTAATPSGIYQITITATDNVGATGTLTFEVIVNLEMTFSPTTPVVVGTADTSTTITTATASGGSSTSYTYSIDQTLNTGNALLLSIDPSLGVITNNGAVDTVGMTVYIDAVDNNALNPYATSVAPGQATIVVVITN